MANRINRTGARDIDILTNPSASAAGRYTVNPISSRRSENSDNPIIDEVIAHLANAYENKRACQVTEWESLRTH